MGSKGRTVVGNAPRPPSPPVGAKVVQYLVGSRIPPREFLLAIKGILHQTVQVVQRRSNTWKQCKNMNICFPSIKTKVWEKQLWFLLSKWPQWSKHSFLTCAKTSHLVGFLSLFLLASPHCLWDSSSLTRDWTHTPCSGVLTSGPPGKPLGWISYWKASILSLNTLNRNYWFGGQTECRGNRNANTLWIQTGGCQPLSLQMLSTHSDADYSTFS